MQTQKGSLVIIDPHTSNPTIFFGGEKVSDVEGIKVTWDTHSNRVMLIVGNTALAAKMSACGIRVRSPL